MSRSRSFLFVLAGLMVAGTVVAAPAKEFRRTVPLAKDGRVELRSERGTAHITAWDRQEVEVFARIEARPESRDPEESVRRTEIKFDATPENVYIRTDFGERLWNGSPFGRDWDPAPLVHYEIKVPHTVDLTVADDRSQIELGDLRGHLRLRTDRSSIEVSSFHGALSVNADRGRITIKQLVLTSDGDFRTDRTDVELGLAPRNGLTLDLSLDRVSPSIDDGLLNGTIHEGRREVSFRGSIGQGGPTLKYTADRGSLRLRRT